jgi:hypothetical protein
MRKSELDIIGIERMSRCFSRVGARFFEELADEGARNVATNVNVESIPANRTAWFDRFILTHVIRLGCHPAHVTAVAHQRPCNLHASAKNQVHEHFIPTIYCLPKSAVEESSDKDHLECVLAVLRQVGQQDSLVDSVSYRQTGTHIQADLLRVFERLTVRTVHVSRKGRA